MGTGKKSGGEAGFGEDKTTEAWSVDFHDKAKKEFDKLNNSPKAQVAKAIVKVSKNPLPQSEGGYGKSLGNKKSSKLAGCLKIKPQSAFAKQRQ